MPRHLLAALLVGVVLVGGGCSGDTKEVGDAGGRDRATTTTAREARDAADDADDAEPADDATATAGSDDAGSDRGGVASTGGGSGRSPGSSGSTGGNADAGTDGDSSGDAKDPAPPATAPPTTFTPDPDRYPRYVELAREYRAEVLGQDDADAQASVFCGDPEGSSQEFLGGAPLDAYPSDLAIVRAYCPEAESKF